MQHDAGISITLVDPYYGPTARVTPLEKILPSLQQEIADVDVVVLRDVDPAVDSAYPAEDLKNMLARRIGRDLELATLSMTTEDGPRRLLCRHEAGPRFGVEGLVPQLRHLELRAQIERSGALYQPPNAHVRLPSGAHANAYLRVADVFDDAFAVKRVADWLDHRISAETILVADTWTILPLLQELSGRRAFSTPGLRNGQQPPILTFVSYPDPDEVRQVFEQIASLAAQPNGRVLFVMTVVSSGDLLVNVRAMAEKYVRGIAFDVVAIANTDAAAPVDSLCFVDGIQRYSADHCALCESPSTQPLVSIDPKRYFPSFRGRRKSQMITAAIAGEHKRFWETADRCQAVRVHATVPQGSMRDLVGPAGAKAERRHREIAIDVNALLTDAEFRQQALDKLARFMPRCDVAVIPGHYASRSLLDLTRHLYPDVRPIELRLPWETEGREQLRSQLRRARRILILDDAVVSGRTMRVLHRIVQDLIHDLPKAEQPAEDYQIRAFAVIGRPHSDAQWTRLTDSLRQTAEGPFLGCCEQLCIPDEGCAWCDERDKIEEVRRRLRAGFALHAESGAAATDLERRVSLLDTRHRLLAEPQTGAPLGLSGLSKSIFICRPDGDLTAGNEVDRLTWHSLFGEQLSEATTYAAVATAMHAVRLKARAAVQETQSTVWEWDWATQRILTGYHDPLIQASFLRAARAEELTLELTPELRASVEEAFYAIRSPTRAASPMLAAEHKWAALIQKYPPAIRDLLIDKADQALGEQAQRAAPNVLSPLVEYLATLKAELLLPGHGVDDANTSS